MLETAFTNIGVANKNKTIFFRVITRIIRENHVNKHTDKYAIVLY